MRAALAAVTLLLVPAVGGQPLDLTFHPPGQASPALEASNVGWVLILFRGGDSHVAMDWPQGGHGWNLTRERVRASYLDGKGVEQDARESEASHDYGPLVAALDFASDDWASLYIEGDGLRLTAGSALADLKPRPDGQCAVDLMTAKEFTRQPARSGGLCPPGDQAVASLHPLAENSSMPFVLTAYHVRAAEWHNAHIQCKEGQECPPGGVRKQDWHPLAFNASFGTEIRTYERLSNDAAPASVNGAGEAVLILAGSSELDLRVDGWLRLPGADVPESCSSCVAPDGKTLQATGNVTLGHLRMTGPGSLSGSLGGSIEGVRFDEASIDPRVLLGLGVGTTAVAVTVGVLALAKALLAFTRVQPDRAMAHPRRRAIKEYVVAHPGTGFRELMRGTGISAASLRHHVEILKQTGHIAEQRHGRSRRFLPVGLQGDQQRMGAILLREPVLNQLTGLVRQNPWLAQKQLTALAAEQFGWSPSTTQHRLGRLVKGSLVETRRSGRWLLYAIRADANHQGGVAFERRREPRGSLVEVAPVTG